MNIDRGFGHHYEAEIAGNLGNFKQATPPTPKPCIDDARRWLGCNPTRQAHCPFFKDGQKQPGCTTYSTTRYKTIYRPGKAWSKPPIDPGDLDGFTTEEAS